MKHLNYDEEQDTLYLHLEPNEPAFSVDCDGLFWKRVTPDGRVIGVEINDFLQVFVPTITSGKQL